MPQFANNESAASIRTKLNNTGLAKNNLAATGAPGISNDTTQGYERGSQWVSNTGVYVCRDATTGAAQWTKIDVSGGTLILASDLGLALTGNPVDGDDGAILGSLLLTLAENPSAKMIRIQFSQDNDTIQPFAIYINSTVKIPSNTEIDFGGIEIIFGANGRIRMQGEEDEIPPGNRVTPVPTGNLARLQTAVSAGATTLELNNVDASSAPSLFNVGEYITIRGENDAAGNSIQRDTVKITGKSGFILTFEPPLENSYAVEYPSSLSPSLPDRTTISIKSSFPILADIYSTNPVETEFRARVSSGALAAIGPGDWVEIEDDLFVSDVYPDTTSANKVNTEVFQVVAVDSTPSNEAVILNRAPLNNFWLSNNPIITKIIPVKNSTVKNAKAKYAVNQTQRNNHAFETIFAVHCHIENIHVERDWDTGFGIMANSHRLRLSTNCTVKNCSTIAPTGLGSGQGYGVTLYYAYGCKVDNYFAQGCRHSLLFQGGGRNIVSNFTSHDCTISDIDFHGINERENLVTDFTVVGGPTPSPSATSRTGIKFGNTFHLYGSHNNIVQNGIVRLGDTFATTTRGIEILPASSGNVVRNVKILNCQYGLLMTDLSVSSDSFAPNDPIFMEENVIEDVIIENTFDYAIRIISDNANAAANTERTTDDLILRNIECRRCAGGAFIRQTNRVIMDNVSFIDQTGAQSIYAMILEDNTNFIARGIAIINGDRGIQMLSCPDALIDDILFDLSGTRALEDLGENNGASVTDMKFRGTTATHLLTGGSTFRALTNAIRRSVQFNSSIATDTTITEATSIVNDSSLAPVVTDGVQIISGTFTPTNPATVLEIEVVVPTIVTSLANGKCMLTLFDGSTCIGVAQQNIDTTGASGNDIMRLRARLPITGYTPRTLTARFGPRDGQTVTFTLYSRHKSGTLARPYMIINELGIVG